MSLGEAEETPLIKVLMANLSGVMLELVTQLLDKQADMTLVGQVEGSVEILLAATGGVDVLLLGVEQIHPLPRVCSHLFAEFPDLRVLTLTRNGESAALYWLGVRRHRLRQLTTSNLATNIRKAYNLNPTIL